MLSLLQGLCLCEAGWWRRFLGLVQSWWLTGCRLEGQGYCRQTGTSHTPAQVTCSGLAAQCKSPCTEAHCPQSWPPALSLLPRAEPACTAHPLPQLAWGGSRGKALRLLGPVSHDRKGTRHCCQGFQAPLSSKHTRWELEPHAPGPGPGPGPAPCQPVCGVAPPLPGPDPFSIQVTKWHLRNEMSGKPREAPW